MYYTTKIASFGKIYKFGRKINKYSLIKKNIIRKNGQMILR